MLLAIAIGLAGTATALAFYWLGHSNGRLYQMQRDDEDYRRENYERNYNLVTGQRLIPDLPVEHTGYNNGSGV